MSLDGSPLRGAEEKEVRGVLRPGTRLRQYELLQVLGQGAFGVTYLARDTTLGRELAIKEYLPSALAVRENGTTVLPRSTAVAEEFHWGRDRFVEEARILATLDEASAVVRVYDFVEENGTAYMVMALVRGETLAHRLEQRGPLGEAEVRRLLEPLLDSLEQVHKAGFLHRDIKPANIILKADGSPTLIDFGASRAAIAGRTSAMTAIFTPGYAAVEQFTSAKQGPSTDIYSLSATLYHAITGKPPANALERMLDDTHVPLGKLRPAGFSTALLSGIDAGLSVKASDRPQSMAGWRLLLLGTVADGEATTLMRSPSVPSPGAGPAVPGTASSPPGRSRGLLYGGAAAALLLAAGGIGYALYGTKPTGSPVVSVQDLKVEDLQKLLDERRKADEAAADKKRLEEEARKQADADAAAKRAADAELVTAQEKIRQAQAELDRLTAEREARRQQEAAEKQQADAAARRAAEQEAQRQAEAQLAALKQAEEDARRKADAEAEAKRQSEAALAAAQAARQKADADAEERRKAEQEAAARTTAEADAAARQKADEDAQKKAAADADRKAAEAAEAGLRLNQLDRQRLQVALSSLGFDTRGRDGVFGPRSREVIAAWQKARRMPETGFLTAAQQQALLKEAASAVAKFDDDQKKQEDEKKAAEEAKKKSGEDAARPAVVVVPPTASPGAAPAGSFDGRWTGQVGDFLVDLTVAGSSGNLTVQCVSHLPASVAVSVSPDGTVSGFVSPSGEVSRTRRSVTGKLPNLTISAANYCQGGTSALQRGGAAPSRPGTR
ncbi:MAG: protein kinase [Proteobacteria bacterium]|nr:protein kinase [Pseudomonadota bacterium]